MIHTDIIIEQSFWKSTVPCRLYTVYSVHYVYTRLWTIPKTAVGSFLPGSPLLDTSPRAPCLQQNFLVSLIGFSYCFETN
jgi:hypothetical protein